MPISVCPNCNQRYSYNAYETDYVHKCNSNSASLNQDDVVVHGDYVDEETGANVTKPKMEVALKSFGVTIGKYTDRGERAETRRQRQHYETIKLK